MGYCPLWSDFQCPKAAVILCGLRAYLKASLSYSILPGSRSQTVLLIPTMTPISSKRWLYDSVPFFQYDKGSLRLVTWPDNASSSPGVQVKEGGGN